ncbi:hypothetical protein CW706_03050 [Candidatus Bathyarchaeota archaeon]|nr:MAG: hypothetical protein CW706_03050 [Candidatus Bathyarchaeota archaeon]
MHLILAFLLIILATKSTKVSFFPEILDENTHLAPVPKNIIQDSFFSYEDKFLSFSWLGKEGKLKTKSNCLVCKKYRERLRLHDIILR